MTDQLVWSTMLALLITAATSSLATVLHKRGFRRH